MSLVAKIHPVSGSYYMESQSSTSNFCFLAGNKGNGGNRARRIPKVCLQPCKGQSLSVQLYSP